MQHFANISDAVVMLPVIAIAEIEFGMAKAENADEAQKAALRQFFAEYPLHLGIDDNSVEPYSLLRAELWRRHGTRKPRGHKEALPEQLFDRISGRELGIDERDLLIVTVAVQYNLTLATTDRNFGMLRIEEAANSLEMEGKPIHLRVADWSVPIP